MLAAESEEAVARMSRLAGPLAFRAGLPESEAALPALLAERLAAVSEAAVAGPSALFVFLAVLRFDRLLFF